MPRRRGWNDFTPAEKFEALHADVNTALDLIDELKQAQGKLEDMLRQIGAELFEVKRRIR